MKSSVKAQKSKTSAATPAQANGNSAKETPTCPVTANSLKEPASSLGERSPASQKQQVRFEWSFPNAKQVFIAGTFNNWQPNATPLKHCGAGRWLLDVALKPGRYEYRFVVDGQWTDDPETEGYGPNPAGGRNSIMVV